MSDSTNIKSWYQDNANKFKAKSVALQAKYNRLSLLRLLVFFLFLALIGMSLYYRSGALLIGVTLIFGLVFGRLIQIHNRVKAKKLHYDRLAEINCQEIQRISLDLQNFPDGSQYQDPGHPYCLDLDLFGSHSLFQWLNRTASVGGERLLARLLLEKSSPKEISARQEAVRELSSAPQWCQDFLASGKGNKVHDDIDAFLDWVGTIAEHPKWFKPVLLILPVLTLGMTAAYFAGYLSGYLVLGILAINSVLLYRVKPMAAHTYSETHRSINILKSYEAMIVRIEQSNFESKLLSNLRTPFIDKQERASATINQLKNILSRVETRNNIFYHIFNAFFFLDIIWLIQAKQWKLKHGVHISHWFESLAAYEVLVSLALTAHSQSNFSYPSLVTDGFYFSTEELGHPLIPENERIANDFSLENQGTVVVLTGSNMSGKSTFLRTIGINIVLARLGAPVCATRMTLGDFSLFTSMRTTDSLEEHVSSFYAELKRIRSLIQMIEETDATMFLLDELLKGTNSQDRNLGSVALIKQLNKGAAYGLISTHDLSLGTLTNHLENVANFSFNSEFINGQLTFDYKLCEGLCKSFNASELMAQMGIDIESNPSNHRLDRD
jgi:hypothetical protein